MPTYPQPTDLDWVQFDDLIFWRLVVNLGMKFYSGNSLEQDRSVILNNLLIEVVETQKFYKTGLFRVSGGWKWFE